MREKRMSWQNAVLTIIIIAVGLWSGIVLAILYGS